MRRHQRGAGGFLVGVVVLVAIVALIGTLVYLQGRSQAERSSQETRRFDAVKTALVQFVAVNGRLPCPANPTGDTGAAEPNAASATCTYPTGTVPWQTIGVRREDAIDAWGWKIAYRVYTGNAGSLTQASGTSMVDCDTSDSLSVGRTPVAGSSGGLCRSTRDTLDTEYVLGKGLTITWFGTAISDAAFVLVSHGPSGRGGYTSGSPSMQTTPLPTNASELANLNATGPFVATAATAASVSPDDAAHFDDVLDYMKLSEIVRLAGRNARDWADTTGLADATLDTATLTTALGSAPSYGDLGTSAFRVGNARITGITSGGTTNISFDTSGGTEGIGGAVGGNTLSSGNDEGLRLDFNTNATKFAVTFNSFGTSVAPLRDTARIDFYNGASLVSTTTKQACRGGDGLASYTIDLGTVEFNKVEIWPVSVALLVPSSFFLSAFKTCTALPCETSLQAPANDCT